MAAIIGLRPVRVERAPKPEAGKGGRPWVGAEGEMFVVFHSEGGRVSWWMVSGGGVD